MPKNQNLIFGPYFQPLNRPNAGHCSSASALAHQVRPTNGALVVLSNPQKQQEHDALLSDADRPEGLPEALTPLKDIHRSVSGQFEGTADEVMAMDRQVQGGSGRGGDEQHGDRMVVMVELETPPDPEERYQQQQPQTSTPLRHRSGKWMRRFRSTGAIDAEPYNYQRRHRFRKRGRVASVPSFPAESGIFDTARRRTLPESGILDTPRRIRPESGIMSNAVPETGAARTSRRCCASCCPLRIDTSGASPRRVRSLPCLLTDRAMVLRTDQRDDSGIAMTHRHDDEDEEEEAEEMDMSSSASGTSPPSACGTDRRRRYHAKTTMMMMARKLNGHAGPLVVSFMGFFGKKISEVVLLKFWEVCG